MRISLLLWVGLFCADVANATGLAPDPAHVEAKHLVYVGTLESCSLAHKIVKMASKDPMLTSKGIIDHLVIDQACKTKVDEILQQGSGHDPIKANATITIHRESITDLLYAGAPGSNERKKRIEGILKETHLAAPQNPKQWIFIVEALTPAQLRLAHLSSVAEREHLRSLIKNGPVRPKAR